MYSVANSFWAKMLLTSGCFLSCFFFYTCKLMIWLLILFNQTKHRVSEARASHWRSRWWFVYNLVSHMMTPYNLWIVASAEGQSQKETMQMLLCMQSNDLRKWRKYNSTLFLHLFKRFNYVPSIFFWIRDDKPHALNCSCCENRWSDNQGQ